MKRIKSYIITGRFLLTLGHLISILLTFWTYKRNILIGTSDNINNNEINEIERNILVCSSNYYSNYSSYSSYF